MWLLSLIAVVLGSWGFVELKAFRARRKKARKKDRMKGYIPNPLYIDFLLYFKKTRRSVDTYTGWYIEYKYLFGYTYVVNEGFEPKGRK